MVKIDFSPSSPAFLYEETHVGNSFRIYFLCINYENKVLKDVLKKDILTVRIC